jgi:hypothetical protein
VVKARGHCPSQAILVVGNYQGGERVHEDVVNQVQDQLVMEDGTYICGWRRLITTHCMDAVKFTEGWGTGWYRQSCCTESIGVN